MKKILLGTSAVALAGASATSANAAEWDVTVGGFFNAWAIYTSEDLEGRDGFDIATNAEIHFKPSITLDNGLQFGAKIELEGEAGGNGEWVDESVMFIEGGFGRVELGAEDSPFGTMGVCSPTNGPAGVCSGTMTGTFMADSYGSAGFASQIAGDAVRINYYTPRFSGFQVGVGYARGNSSNDRFFEDRDAPGTDVDIFSIGANYTGDFGGVSVKLAGTYETATRNDNDDAIAFVPGTDLIPAVAGTPGTPPVLAQDARAGIIRQADGTLRAVPDTDRFAQIFAGRDVAVIIPSQVARAGSAGTAPTLGTPEVAAVPAVRAQAATNDGDKDRFHLGASLGFGGMTIGGGYANYSQGSDDVDFFDLGVGYSQGPWGVSLGGSMTDRDASDTTAIALNGQYKLGPGVKAVAFAGYAEQDFDGGGSKDGFTIGTGIHLGF